MVNYLNKIIKKSMTTLPDQTVKQKHLYMIIVNNEHTLFLVMIIELLHFLNCTLLLHEFSCQVKHT